MKRRLTWFLIALTAIAGCNGSYRSGDRVLVSKFDYELGLTDPRRFDVVVFKYPVTPTKNGVARNYIKRLLGLPGEILAIFFGQLFVMPPRPGEAPHFDDLKGLSETQAEILRKRLWIKTPVFDGTRNCEFTPEERAILLAALPADFPRKIQHMDAQEVGKLPEAERYRLTQQLWIHFLADWDSRKAENPLKIWRALGRDTVSDARTREILPQLDRTDDPRTHDWFRLGKFEPVRKSPEVMLAMRRIVYDNDFPAQDLIQAKIPPRWTTEGTAWSGLDGQGFRHEGKSKQLDWLRYQHIVVPRRWPLEVVQGKIFMKVSHEGKVVLENFDASSIKPQLITDSLDYNGNDGTSYNWVGDLMLECKLTVHEPKGEFALQLSRGKYQYQARWDLAKGICKLFRQERQGNGWEELAAAETAVSKAGSYQLRFANFDSRLTLWVDKALPFGPGHDYLPPELPTAKEVKDAEANKLGYIDLRDRLALRCGPTPWDLDEPASIGSKEAHIDVHNVRLWRDTYYTLSHQGNNSQADYDDPSIPGEFRDVINFRNPATWDKLRHLNYKTMYVQPNHFLVMGDNSQSSSDSRSWGLVPERLMLGRALMVYFPFDRAGPIR